MRSRAGESEMGQERQDRPRPRGAEGARIVAIVGPTAVGKSALSLRLAHLLGGDIVSADSRQVYRYMDIGTAKPTPAERSGVRHWMLDLVEPSDVYTAGRFKQEGRGVLARLAAEHRIAFVTGGTGFYIRALLDGAVFPSVEPDPAFREELRKEADERGPAALWKRLERVDPRSAARVHPNNQPRLIRALEVVAKLGGPVPVAEGNKASAALYVGLSMDRDRLRDRADARVLTQVEAGLVRETELLLDMGYDSRLPALSGFGYREMVAHLEGKLSLDQAIGAYQLSTRQFIRRQMTWFRSDSRIRWFDVEEQDADSIAAWVRSTLQDTDS